MSRHARNMSKCFGGNEQWNYDNNHIFLLFNTNNIILYNGHLFVAIIWSVLILKSNKNLPSIILSQRADRFFTLAYPIVFRNSYKNNDEKQSF